MFKSRAAASVAEIEAYESPGRFSRLSEQAERARRKALAARDAAIRAGQYAGEETIKCTNHHRVHLRREFYWIAWPVMLAVAGGVYAKSEAVAHQQQLAANEIASTLHNADEVFARPDHPPRHHHATHHKKHKNKNKNTVLVASK